MNRKELRHDRYTVSLLTDHMVFSHVCVGLHFGELRGELRTLEMIREVSPVKVIITGLMPVAGTPMAHIKPRQADFEKVITRAVEMFPDTPVVLGCAHSSGKDREEIEMIAIKCGVSGIAAPTVGTARFARENGFEVNYYGMCCGLVPGEGMRIEVPLWKYYNCAYIPRYKDYHILTCARSICLYRAAIMWGRDGTEVYFIIELFGS